jgi:ABC-type glycerol-3-phosphate transport system permease component
MTCGLPYIRGGVTTRCCNKSSPSDRTRGSWVRSGLVARRRVGRDYSVVSAVGVFYLVPSLSLYLAAQRYLMRMSIGNVKG